MSKSETMNAQSVERLTHAVTDRAHEQKRLMDEIASNKVSQIESETEERVERILQRAREEADVIEAELVGSAAAITKVEDRISVLRHKQEVVSDVLNAARTQLEEESPSKKQERYKSYLAENLRAESSITPASGETEIITQILAELNLTNDITVLEEGGFKGGYILHTDDFDLDKSYRTVFRQEEDTLRELAAKILFQEEK